jgi:hypothetical protein
MTREKISKPNFFGDADLNNIAGNPDFKEDSIREEIVLPILSAELFKVNAARN